MVGGIIWMLIGIGVIIFNATSESTKLVFKGTHIDYGYIAIIVGIVLIIISAVRGSEQKEQINKMKETLNDVYPETRKKLRSGTPAQDVAIWLVEAKSIPKEVAVEFINDVANEIKAESK